MKKGETLFQELLGCSPSIKILEQILTYRDIEFSCIDLVELTKLPWTTIEPFWNVLIDTKMIVLSRTVRKIGLYKLNESNLLMNVFIDIFDKLMKRNLDTSKEQEILMGEIYCKKTAKSNRVKYIVENILEDDAVYFHSNQTGTHYQWTIENFKKKMRKI